MSTNSCHSCIPKPPILYYIIIFIILYIIFNIYYIYYYISIIFNNLNLKWKLFHPLEKDLPKRTRHDSILHQRLVCAQDQYGKNVVPYTYTVGQRVICRLVL